MEETRTQNNNTKAPKWKKFALYGVGACIGAVALTWAIGQQSYQDKFLTKTYINDQDVSKMTPIEATEAVKRTQTVPQIKVIMPNKKEITYKYTDLGGKTNPQEEVNKILSEQDAKSWMIHDPHHYEIKNEYNFDEDKLEDVLRTDISKNNVKINLADAVIYDQGSQKFTPNKNVPTQSYDVDQLIKVTVNAINAQTDEIDLTKLKHDDAAVKQLLSEANNMLNTKIHIKYGTESEELNRDSIAQSMVFEGNQFDVNRDALGSYLATISQQHNYQNDDYIVSYDTRLLVQEISTSIEKFEPKDFIAKENKVKKMKPVEEKKEDKPADNKNNEAKKEDNHSQNVAAAPQPKPLSENEKMKQIYPFCQTIQEGTYVLVQKQSQTFCAVINGQLKYGGQVVTGDETKGHGTPPGDYLIWDKKMNETLRGEGLFEGPEGDYVIPVKYWMPIDGTGIGLHSIDPDEVTGSQGRVNWAPNAYLTGHGSHGCVNVHTQDAAWVFNNMPINTRVHVQ